MHRRLPDHAPTSSTSPQLPLWFYLGNSRDCFPGRVMWSRLDLALCHVARAPQWLTTQGRGGLTWMSRKAAAPSSLSLASAVSSSSLILGHQPCPIQPAWEQRGSTERACQTHGLRAFMAAGEVWTGRSGVPTPSAPLSLFTLTGASVPACGLGCVFSLSQSL